MAVTVHRRIVTRNTLDGRVSSPRTASPSCRKTKRALSWPHRIVPSSNRVAANRENPPGSLSLATHPRYRRCARSDHQGVRSPNDSRGQLPRYPRMPRTSYLTHQKRQRLVPLPCLNASGRGVFVAHGGALWARAGIGRHNHAPSSTSMASTIPTAIVTFHRPIPTSDAHARQDLPRHTAVAAVHRPIATTGERPIIASPQRPG